MKEMQLPPPHRLFYLITLIGVSALLFLILRPFALTIFFSVVLAIVLHPLFAFINHRIHRETLASLLTILIALIVVGIPLYFIATQVAKESISVYQKIAVDDISFHALATHPASERLAQSIGLSSGEIAGELERFVKSVSGAFVSHAISFGAATADFFLKVAIALYLLFFLLRDDRKLYAYCAAIVPLEHATIESLSNRFSSTVRSIVKGTFVVAFMQGIVGALIFALAEVENPIMWGMLMGVFALIPAIGPFVVWLPAGLILLISNAIPQALIVLIGGSLIIGSIDNFLRPALVAREGGLPDALILLSILGGIASFGVAGVLAGPIIAALFLSVWESFGKESGKETLQTK